ncbi:hypothetical protein [Streptomyces sp. ODS28]|uniref:hypothetical protein n=1 Tax=Streptomyces sp. ODS28 TaxID=3136688 RepID=UPI0031EBF5F1
MTTTPARRPEESTAPTVEGYLACGVQAARIASGFLLTLTPTPPRACRMAVERAAGALVDHALAHSQTPDLHLSATSEAVHLRVSARGQLPLPSEKLLPPGLAGTVTLDLPQTGGTSLHACVPRC